MLSAIVCPFLFLRRLADFRFLPILLVVCAAIAAERRLDANPVIIEDDTPPDRPLLALDTGGHTGAICKMVASGYGDQLISVSGDKTVRFWDLATGEAVRVLRPPVGSGNFGYLFAVAISPDGKTLAVGGYRAQTPLYDHRIHLIALPEGRIIHSLKGHAYAIYDLAFSPDGTQLASASHDATVRLWDVENGTPIKVLQGHASVVNEVTWSPDGKHLLSGSTDKTARIWSAASGSTEAILRDHTAEVSAVAWSPDGRSIATGGKDRAVRVYEPSGKLRYTWPRTHNEVDSVAFSPDSKQLLYTFGSNADPPVGAAILDMVDGHERTRYSGHDNGVTCGLFLHDGREVATGDSISGIRIWDPATGKTLRRLDGQGKSVFAVGWSPDGQAVAWGNVTDPYVERVGPPVERTFCFSRLAFGPKPNNQFVRARPRMSGMQIGQLIQNGQTSDRVVGIERGGAVLSTFTLPDAADHIRSYSLLPGNRAVVGTDSRAYVYNSLNGQIDSELNDRSGEVWGMAPSPDFRYLLTGTNDQICRVWSLATGKPLVSLFVAGQEWIAWTPEGYYAASLAGESLMGWHINHGGEQMADFYSASQFHDSLYRPDVIRRVLEMGSVARALEIADRQRETQSRPLTVANVLPPRVTITAPSESQVDSRQSQLTVRASAKAVEQDTIQSMRLIVDGRPYGPAQAASAPAASSPAPPENEPAANDSATSVKDAATVEHEWTVELPPGKHKVQVKAETADSYGLSQQLQVIQTNPGAEPPAADAPPPTAPAGNLYVLSIDTQPPRAGATPQARAGDGQAVSAALAKGGKSHFDQVITRELTGPAATPAAIHDELEKLRSRMTLADTAVVYYAGQDGLDSAGHYILRGASSTAGGAAEVSTTDVQSELAATQGRVTLMLDLTRSDEHSRREATAGFCGSSEKQDASAKLDAAAAEWLRELLTEDYGVVVISSRRSAAGGGAAAPAQGAKAPAQAAAAGQSPLVQAFSEAVSGRADANRDGTVDLKELAPYVTDRVRTLSGGTLTPTIERPRGARSFRLGSPAAPPASGKP